VTGAADSLATPSSGVPVQDAEPSRVTGSAGERLTRDEAFDLLRRSVASLVQNDDSARASVVRDRARDLLGRDSESLNERNFIRILKDAHDADIIDLRRRGDDFEVARSEAPPSVSEQLAKAQPAPAPRPDAGVPARLSLRSRGRGGRSGALPPELLALGVVSMPSRSAENGAPSVADVEVPKKRAAGAGRKRAKAGAAAAATDADASPRAAKRPRRPAAKKAAKSGEA
jgi:hypothetical protein